MSEVAGTIGGDVVGSEVVGGVVGEVFSDVVGSEGVGGGRWCGRPNRHRRGGV